MIRGRTFRGRVLNSEFILPNFKSEYLSSNYRLTFFYNAKRQYDFNVVERKDGFYFIDVDKNYEGKELTLKVFAKIDFPDNYADGGTIESLLENVAQNVYTNRSNLGG